MAENFVNKKTQVSIIAVATLSFLGILVETSLNVTFPLLTHEFSVSLSTIQWVTSGYLLMVTIVMSATGFLNNRFNAKNLFRVALLFNLIGTILCVLSQQFIVLFLGRLLQAISTGIATPLMYHIILSVVPVGKRGTYMGLAAMIISLAPALGPTYGGTLSAFSSWRAIFIITIPVILLAAWIGERNISLVPNKTDQKFDWWGIILLAITFGSLSLSFANAGNYGFTSYRFIEMLIVFCLTTLVFGFKMQHSSKKILDFKLLLQPVVGLRWINFFVLQFINIGISFVIPLFLENRLHVNSFITGLVLLPGALAGALISPYAGRLFDHSGAFRPLLFSSITLISGTGLFFATSSKISVWGVTLLYILLRVGFNLGFSNSMSDASLHITSEKNSNFNSIFNTFQQYAGSLGTSVLAAVISVNQFNNGNLSHSTEQGSRIAYGILLILAIVSLITVIAVKYLFNDTIKTEQR